MEVIQRNTLQNLPTEIKIIIVAFVDTNDKTHRLQQVIKTSSTYPRLIHPSILSSTPNNVDRAPGEPGAIVQVRTESKSDKRRHWRRWMGFGISALFRVDREFSNLAAPYLFTVRLVFFSTTRV